jgi:hypothetical protein
MEPIKDLIEDWIVVRTTLVRHLGMLKSDPSVYVTEVTTETTVVRLEACLRELNALLKDHARTPTT